MYSTPRNKKRFTEIAFQIFVNFGLFSEGVAAPADYSFFRA